MHAYIITGATGQIRMDHIRSLCESWHVDRSDIMLLSKTEGKNSIGVEDVRSFTGNLHIAPNANQGRVGIISPADSLTIEAQQALLKTVEEPPGKTRIILEADGTGSLLGTILSRCQHIALSGHHEPTEEDQTLLNEVNTACKGKTAGDIVKLVSQKFSKKEDSIRFLDTYLFFTHRKLVEETGQKNDAAMAIYAERTDAIRAALKAYSQLRANTSPSMVMDTFFFTIFLDKEYCVVYND